MREIQRSVKIGKPCWRVALVVAIIGNISKRGRNLKKKQTGKSFPFKCHKCKQLGHKAVNCDVKVKSSEKSAKIEEMGFLITMNQQCSLKMEGTPPGTKSCLDSGCTSHMCNDKRKFVHSEACESKKLSLATSATTNIEFRGTVKLLITVCN